MDVFTVMKRFARHLHISYNVGVASDLELGETCRFFEVMAKHCNEYYMFNDLVNRALDRCIREINERSQPCLPL